MPDLFARPAAPASAAAPAAPAAAPAMPPKAALQATPRPFKRRDTADEEELRRQLADMPEVGLGASGPAVLMAYLASIEDKLSVSADFDLTDPAPLLSVRPDLRRLRLRGGPGSQQPARAAATLAALAKKLHAQVDALAPPRPDGRRGAAVLLRETLRVEVRGKRPEWLRAEAIPTLLQLLMHEDAPVRLMLVELLADIPGKAATTALAQRAAFDLDADAREAAVEALRSRPADDWRPVFLRALRYPWAAAADHAAEALAALDDRDAVPALVTLLKQPDPAGPRSLPGNSVVVQEVVRAAHKANCLLCHPPALSGDEVLFGKDPVVQIPAALVSAHMLQDEPPPAIAELSGGPLGPSSSGMPSGGGGSTPSSGGGSSPPSSGGSSGGGGGYGGGSSGGGSSGGGGSTGGGGGGSMTSGGGSSRSGGGGCASGSSGSRRSGQSTSSLSSSGQPSSGQPARSASTTRPAWMTRPAAMMRQGMTARRPTGRGGRGGGSSSLAAAAQGPQLTALPVRADITFLRQDFSVQQPAFEVLAGAPEPPRLRFDYVVRTRELTLAEKARLKKQAVDRPSYPQRDAVLFALRELTGRDAGTTTEAWQELFPQAELDVAAAHLSRRLVHAASTRQGQLLAEFRDAKGLVYTLAIACAVPSLPEATREKAREALADRMARMTPDTLRDKLQDEDPEVRRAAVAACARREEASLVPDLLALLDDPEPLVARLAEAGLRTLTGQDLDGPEAWKAWHNKQEAAPKGGGG
jgi:HEAT repeat protein